MTPITEIVDVIIPVFNQFDYVSRVLNSIFGAEESCNFEVIVIDDCSTDEKVVDLLRCYAGRGKIRLFENEKNLGFTGSVCFGMKLAPDRDVVLLNSDTEVYSNWLSRLRRVCSAQNMVCSVSPLSNHSSISSYPKPFTDNKEPLELSYRELDAIVAEANKELSCETLTTSGFCMYITRASMNRVGYFDEDAFARGYGEETDFCIRARKLGWRHFVAADVFVRHASSASFGEERHGLYQRAMSRLYTKYPEYKDLLVASCANDRLQNLRARIDFKRIKEFAKGYNKVELVVRTDRDDELDNPNENTCYLFFTGTGQGDYEIGLFPHIDVPNIPKIHLTTSDFELANVLCHLPITETEILLVSRDQRSIAFELIQKLRKAMVVSRAYEAVANTVFDGEIKVGAVDADAQYYVGAIPCVGSHAVGRQKLKALFFKFIDTVQPAVFLDLGAHKGEVGVAVKQLLPQCQVHSFEAGASLASELKRSSAPDGVCVNNYAVAEVDGDVALYRPRMLSWYYIRDVLVRAKSYSGGDLGNSSLRKRSEYAFYDTEIVPGIRIDTFFRELKLQGPIAVWIDCEGAALEVLKGFGDTIDLVELIHVELEAFRFWEGQALVSEVVDFLVARDFEPLLRDAEYGDWQFNYIFVKKTRLNTLIDIVRNDDVSATANAPITTSAQSAVFKAAGDRNNIDIRNIPIFVPCFNNATYCDLMLKQLLEFGFRNITYVDNASRALSMLKWLDGASKYASIEVMSENLGPKESIFTPKRLGALPRWFCVTDPDLRFSGLLPDRWLNELAFVSERFQAGKVGFALNVSDKAIFRTQKFDIDGEQYHIWDWEKQFWSREIGRTKTGDSLYYAPIDTTFALYDKNCFNRNDFLDGIRVGGRYTSLHLPWYNKPFVDHVELEEYKATQRFSYYYR